MLSFVSDAIVEKQHTGFQTMIVCSYGNNFDETP